MICFGATVRELRTAGDRATLSERTPVTRPIFADPKTDFAFKRIFGTEAHKSVLISLLNDLLARSEAHKITDLTYLPEDQRPVVAELKASIVDVKCKSADGTQFVVEMQVLNVEGFEKRVVYNTSKAYVRQLESGDKYAELNDVIGISICDFQLWPKNTGEADVPLVSRWRMKEEADGRAGLSQVQYVFVELPKFPMDAVPTSAVEQWAYFFRHANELKEVPSVLTNDGPRAAMTVAKTTGFTERDWDQYDRALMAEQDARGALSLAQRVAKDEGRTEGRTEGALGKAKQMLQRTLAVRFQCTSDARVEQCTDVATIEHWFEKSLAVSTLEEVFAEE